MNLLEDLGRKTLTKPIKQLEADADGSYPISSPEDCMVQKKYDGARVILYKGDAYSRAGKPLCKVSPEVREALAYSGVELRNMVFDMELLVYENTTALTPYTAEQIAGFLHSHDPIGEEHVVIKVFDAIGLRAFERGHEGVPYEERINRIPDILRASIRKSVANFKGAAFIDYLKDTLEEPRMSDVEGFVLRKHHAPWNLKRDWGAMKLTRSTVLDCEILSIHEGEGKRSNTVGYIKVIMPDLNIIKVDLGKGWNDIKRKHMFENQEDYTGKTIEVYAKEVSTHGVLRQPKAGQIRLDK